jgi:hypothetical protein
MVCALLVSAAAAAQPAGIRGACKIFVERSLIDKRGADFGEFSAWTVVDNRDGTYSVGAKYSALGVDGQLRGRYTTCIIKEGLSGFPCGFLPCRVMV